MEFPYVLLPLSYKDCYIKCMKYMQMWQLLWDTSGKTFAYTFH